MIDGHVIRNRRIERGISQPELARRAALHCGILAHIERTGAVGDLSIGQLDRIGRCLGLPPTLDSKGAAACPDAVELGALIGRQETTGRSASDLCWALGWSHSRMENALEELRRCLSAAGQSLVIGEHEALEIEPMNSDRTVKALRSLPTRVGVGDLTPSQLRIVLTVARLTKTPDGVLLQAFDHSDRPAIGGLVRQGYLSVDGDRVELGEVALESLEPVLDRFRPSSEQTARYNRRRFEAEL